MIGGEIKCTKIRFHFFVLNAIKKVLGMKQEKEILEVTYVQGVVVYIQALKARGIKMMNDGVYFASKLCNT